MSLCLADTNDINWVSVLFPGRGDLSYVYSSLGRKGKYKPFALKCPWLGEISSCDSPAGFKLLKLFDFVLFLCLSFPIPLAQGFS